MAKDSCHSNLAEAEIVGELLSTLTKVETPIHDNIKELVSWSAKSME